MRGRAGAEAQAPSLSQHTRPTAAAQPVPWPSRPSAGLPETELIRVSLPAFLLEAVIEKQFSLPGAPGSWSCEIKPQRTQKKHCLPRSRRDGPGLPSHSSAAQTGKMLALPTRSVPTPI